MNDQFNSALERAKRALQDAGRSGHINIIHEQVVSFYDDQKEFVGLYPRSWNMGRTMRLTSKRFYVYTPDSGWWGAGRTADEALNELRVRCRASGDVLA